MSLSWMSRPGSVGVLCLLKSRVIPLESQAEASDLTEHSIVSKSFMCSEKSFIPFAHKQMSKLNMAAPGPAAGWKLSRTMFMC